MHTTAFAALLLALTPGPLPPAQAPAADFAELDAYIAARLEATAVPGAAWAVVHADGTAHEAYRGEDGDGEPVTGSTPFLWGSVAKPVTATAVMTLVEDGRIDLDEPARTYLPDFTLADPDHADQVTVRHLLEQTSGIPEGSGVTDHFDADADADPYGRALADLADTAPTTEPGTGFEYASANYLVLGALVQAVADMPYEEYLREAVLDPLGMDTAVADAAAAAEVPDGHAYAFGRPVAIDAPFDPTGPSYGYLGGTAADLAAFAAANLSGGAGVLTPESQALMQTPAASMNERVDYGLGWKLDDRNADLGTTTVWHTGGAPGYSAAVILLPDLDLGVVLAQNAYGFFQDGALVETALGAARVAAGATTGADPSAPATDWTYPAMLVSIALLLTFAVAVVVQSLRRIRKGAPAAGRRWRVWTGMAVWTAVGLAVAYVGLVAVPALAPSRVLLVLMAPDVGWGMYALAGAALVVVAVRLWLGAVRLRRTESA
ncbi:serine hydrolase domain-containing protein [Glycomyces paridis]|uniref:Beta-lactamase family protein n=1 Tax=Glycomyces paridis TaxID=2126555 RepID=A0A4S8P880_9ACTN|nr:serine hydrolase domain-containing protein [Glycomyces paridis]THV26420.1 beta-lactamase family protein [Glycomyces paridis]